MRRVREVTDMRYPAAWYPAARGMKRTIHLHVGPTNSGKTYQALQALINAKSGVYCGPLRLLAHEVWERINNGSLINASQATGVDILDAAGDMERPPIAGSGGSSVDPPTKGIPCNLLTGEERRIVIAGGGLLSCTVEMVPLNTFFEVAIIDEIQMINDVERGHAWTSALLGVCAKEVHLCGEATVVDLIRRLAAETQDELVVHHYERLTPLKVSESLGGNLREVTKGDCVVAFSRKDIFKYKAEIERLTGLRCAVAYGKLPPEVRSEQAQRFNDPESGFDVLVASDAIGMGLNL
jgi:ATP-dependent RNA helicase SUPV3L1/SUV3